jgi:cell fate regulator YaaT (PSP1 superfamily)
LGILSLPEDFDAVPGRWVVVQSPRGEEQAFLAGALDPHQEEVYRRIRTVTEQGEGASRSEPAVSDLSYLWEASAEDLTAIEALREAEEQVLRASRELLRGHHLTMKIIDAEFIQDKRKLFLYFTSESRVDFRGFVRDLAREFKVRIELRQVGVRDEARIVRGMGPCGRPCCCGTWLNQFAPICIRMVKEQNLALNPTKISGICGRLMCCMGYEHEAYRELWKGLPNPGSKIKTPKGNYLLMGADLKERAIRCRPPEGGEISVPVDRFEEFKEKVMAGEDWIVAEKSRRPAPAHSRDGAGPIPAPVRPVPRPPREPEALPSAVEPAAATSPGDAAKKKRRRRKKPKAEPGENRPTGIPGEGDRPADRGSRGEGKTSRPRPPRPEAAPAPKKAEEVRPDEGGETPRPSSGRRRRRRRPGGGDREGQNRQGPSTPNPQGGS